MEEEIENWRRLQRGRETAREKKEIKLSITKLILIYPFVSVDRWCDRVQI